MHARQHGPFVPLRFGPGRATAPFFRKPYPKKFRKNFRYVEESQGAGLRVGRCTLMMAVQALSPGR